jgi:hypothetical protein
MTVRDAAADKQSRLKQKQQHDDQENNGRTGNRNVDRIDTT